MKAMLPGLGSTPPPRRWGREELALDDVRHDLYAAATGLVFDLLDRRTRRAHVTHAPLRRLILRAA